MKIHTFCPVAEFLADVRKDLSKPSEEADRASNSTTTNSGDLLGRPSASAITTDERNAQPAIKSFKPPVSEFTFHFPKPNSISAQNLTNERPMDIIFRIVTPPGASSQAPDRARAKSATKKTQDPPELTLWALLQRDGYTLFPPPTGSVLETAISLAFPRPASETARRGWPALERLLYRPSTKDGISRFFPI